MRAIAWRCGSAGRAVLVQPALGVQRGHVAGRDFLAGSRSIADPYLFVLLVWTKIVKVDLSGLENLKRFEQHMRSDAGVQKALKAQGLNH